MDHPKRLDLLVRAFQQVRGKIEFRIAGTGPENRALWALAAEDPRIRLLDHVSDQELSRLYADAFFVLFVPYDEDYGLVTIEAMKSGKAVLTTIDAGGVNEFVEHGVTGLCVATKVPVLAAAMQRMLATARKPYGWAGATAGERVRLAVDSGADTGRTATAQSGKHRATQARGHCRLPRIPAPKWGPEPDFHLYRALARQIDVTLITLCDDVDTAGVLDLAPGLREIRVAKFPAHLKAAQALNRKLAASVGDITSLLHYWLTPAYLERLARATACCDLVVASHPYLYTCHRRSL